MLILRLTTNQVIRMSFSWNQPQPRIDEGDLEFEIEVFFI